MDSLADISATSKEQASHKANQDAADLYDARTRLRIMTDNQVVLLDMYKESAKLLSDTTKELNELRANYKAVLNKLDMSERETKRMLDMKQKADSEKEAIRQESARAFSQADEARQRLQIDHQQLQQVHRSTMERSAKSRKEMENEMIQLIQQLDAERKKVLLMNMEKGQQEVAFMTLQQRFLALERMATELTSETPNNHPSPS
ncbi:hypothetical protein K450DRAFT_261460 [Umbelopsis ramanniana AG]|uniref:Uncharacterized protein n=1 Tax=Umbelopsis ramanniana AG TaxID=1314678 RepID=A0AAD5H8A1_UMBRA|nr:uncharacterized protein K450DRAFT_261460 [Umbelopsis ramanniana AG]KAI8575492.1 hypothetical protein K450DRAFT_261460 [Umbelopsis ramanniana AG]